MVTSIVPGANGAHLPGIEPRAPRPDPGAAQQRSHDRAARGDAVEIGAGAQWASVRESVRAGLAQIEETVRAGQQALGLASKIRDAAGAEPPDQHAVDELLEQLGHVIDEAVSAGARLLAGEDLRIQAEPGADPIRVAGFDARLGEEPGAVFAFGRGAEAGEELVKAADASIAALQTNLTRLAGAGRTLAAHQTFLGAAGGALDGVRNDLDADGARLLALQVRQGLDAAGVGAIANVEPQSVLTLFRA